MRKELIKALTDIKDHRIITNILMNMSNADITNLMSLLEYADEDTRNRWLAKYSELMKLS